MTTATKLTTPSPAHNIVFQKAGYSHFAGSESLKEGFVLRMKFSAKSPRLQKYKKRQVVN